ncbi:Fc.00g082690.m01.CDS01 [Cosmosporella sp. VM-42]
MAEMASRISDLEKSLAKARDERLSAPTTPISDMSNVTSSAQSAGSVHTIKSTASSRDDILVQTGASSHYFNEILLSRVIEEVIDLTPSAGTKYWVLLDNSGTFSTPSGDFLIQCIRNPLYAFPLATSIGPTPIEATSCLKLLHLPSDEPKVYSVINDPATAPFNNLALCFAIYFASTVSLNGPEAQAILGQDKHAHLASFKVGLEQAFAQGNFLDCPTLTGLHALAIYLSALRVRNRGKGMWILNGLAVRIAQSLGLHRDGKRLGLSPFESEIRRRLWWHLLSRDCRAGEDYGLENTNGLSLLYEVSLPLNIDDAELYPDMKTLPVPKKGWTAMTFSLVNIDLAKAMQRLAATAASSSPLSPPSESARARMLQETRARIEERLEHCNPVIPQHRLTLLCSHFLIRKLDFISRIQWVLLQCAGPHTDFVTEENLNEALEILEPRLHTEDDLLKQFAWARKAYPQYHVMMYVLWHLCIRPEGPNVKRAWNLIDIMFSHELRDESNVGLGSRSAVLTALKAKAMSMKEKISKSRAPANTTQNADGNTNSGRQKGQTADGDTVQYFFQDMDGNELDFEMGGEEWPNWATLVHGFQSDGPDALWPGTQL